VLIAIATNKIEPKELLTVILPEVVGDGAGSLSLYVNASPGKASNPAVGGRRFMVSCS
jgi:hypothetical protein